MKCPPKPDLIGILLGVIGCIVCVGVVTLLLWKAFTTVHDRWLLSWVTKLPIQCTLRLEFVS